MADVTVRCQVARPLVVMEHEQVKYLYLHVPSLVICQSHVPSLVICQSLLETRRIIDNIDVKVLLIKMPMTGGAGMVVERYTARCL